jgi:hypothetical protein
MVRGGIRASGDDVGRYTSIAVGSDGQARIAYYDTTHGALRYATASGNAWSMHVVDGGDPQQPMGTTVGYWASLVLRADGAPGIAYYAEVPQPDGSHATELRFAQANGPSPASAADWAIAKVATGTIPAPPMGAAPPAQDLPAGIGLFPALARLADGRPVIAYYDHQRGNLVLATASSPAGTTFARAVLDGEDTMMMDTGDVGLYPSIAVEAGDVVHVTYVDALHSNLLYVNTHDRRVEVVDDGYRTDGQNAEGLAEPVLHFVGDDSALALAGGARVVAYQDATSHELLWASRAASGQWMRDSVAGSNPDDGAFGFFVGLGASGNGAVISSYVINQRSRPPAFFVQLFAHTIMVP